MKKTIKYLFAAIALLAAASCQNDILTQESNEISGERIITASFATTRTTLNGMAPKWTVDDKVKITDGTNLQEYTLVNSISDAATQALIANGGSTFSVSIPSEWGTTIYAVYPASAYVGISNGNAQISIATSQTGTFAESNISVAKTTGTTLSFKNATAILMIDGKCNQISKISLSANGSGGTYAVKDIEDNINIEAVSAENGIDVTPAAENHGPYYIAVAPVSYSNMTFNYKNSNDVVIGSRATSSKNLGKNKIYSIGYAVIENAIPGLFSVSDTKKVAFSKGNLQATYNGNAYTWDFAAHQYEFVGNNAGNTTIANQTNGAKVDLFGWSTANTNYGICASQNASDYSGDFKDWGQALGASSTWNTLTTEEWLYLLSYQNEDLNYYNAKRAGKHACGVTVAGITNCIVLYPDDWRGTVVSNLDTHSYATAEEWAEAESKGVVCLPSAGSRGYEVESCGINCHYWTSSAHNENDAYHMTVSIFQGQQIDKRPQDTVDRKFGMAVRLVTE